MLLVSSEVIGRRVAFKMVSRFVTVFLQWRVDGGLPRPHVMRLMPPLAVELLVGTPTSRARCRFHRVHPRAREAPGSGSLPTSEVDRMTGLPPLLAGAAAGESP